MLLRRERDQALSKLKTMLTFSSNPGLKLPCSSEDIRVASNTSRMRARKAHCNDCGQRPRWFAEKKMIVYVISMQFGHWVDILASNSLVHPAKTSLAGNVDEGFRGFTARFVEIGHVAAPKK